MAEIKYSTTGLQKINMINLICDGHERRHYSNRPGVLKLCRNCMRLILRELVERINYETDMHNSYTDAINKSRGTEYECLIPLLHEKVGASRKNYLDYISLQRELMIAKLHTAECTICNIFKEYM